MPLTRSRLLHRVLLPLALLGAFSSRVEAQWYRTYEDGLQALKHEDWPAAIDKLKAAKDEAARAGRRPGRSVLRYGGLREPFLPDYFLSQAYIGRARSEKDPAARKRFYEQAATALEAAKPVQVDAAVAQQLEAELRSVLSPGSESTPSKPAPAVDVASTPEGGEAAAAARAREELQALIVQGERALNAASWDVAANTFGEAERRLAANPGLRREFGQVKARQTEAVFARDAVVARQALADGRFAVASDALDRLGRQSTDIKPATPAVQTLLAAVPRDLQEARAGQALLDADAAFRASRWSAAQQAYESAARLAEGITFSSARGRELSAQLRGRLRDAKVNEALGARRYLDALAIDPTNRAALEGQYGVASAAYTAGRWEEAVAGFEGLLKYSKNYRDSADRSLAAGIQVESGFGATADATNAGEARQHYERVLALRQGLHGALADSPAVVRAVERASDRLRQIDGRQALESARRLYRNGQWDEARKGVNVVLRLLPADKEASDLLVLLNDTAKGERVRTLTTQAKDALARRDLTGAETAAQTLRTVVPGNETAEDVIAQVVRIRGARRRVYQWIGALTGVALIGPLLLVSPRRRGRFFATIGRPTAALRLYRRVLTAHPTDGETLARAADIAVKHRLDAPLESHFDAYVRARPDDTRLAAKAAGFFWDRGQKDRAIAVYGRLVADARPSLPPEAFARLEEVYPGRLPAEILPGLERIHHSNTADRDAVRLLARHYAAVDRFDTEALDCYRLACADNPDDALLRMSYAKALLAAGSWETSAAEAERSLQLLPGDDDALNFLAKVYARGAEEGQRRIANRLDALGLPVESRLVVREALFRKDPTLRTELPEIHGPGGRAGSDPAIANILQAHEALDREDLAAARAALDAGAECPRQSSIVLRATLDAYGRYETAAIQAGQPVDPALRARLAELYAEGGWWEASVSAWQGTVSVPEWNRKSMAAIESILDPLPIEEIARIYFGTAGWNTTVETSSGQASCFATPPVSSTAEFRTQFERTPVFCFSTVVTIDEAVTVKRAVLDEAKGSRDRVAFLIATQPIRNDVYALIYAFMTEEPSVTIVPIDARAIRGAIVEARSHVHLERTLHQWLGHTDVFEAHNPVSNAATFFGRGQLINQLALKISRGQNFGIFGLRKIGKTSLVYRLRELARDDLVAYVDLQGVASSRTEEVYLRLLDSLVRDLRVKHPDVKVPPLSLSGATPPAEVAVSFHHDMLAIRNAFEEPNRRLPHILLLLDEIELMVPHGDGPGFAGYQDFFRHIRGLHQQERFVVSAVVGATPTVCRTATWDGRDNPAFQFYDEVFLASLDRQECDQMVQGLGELMGLRFDQASLRLVHEQTAGHPYVARQLCSRLAKLFPDRPLDVHEDMVEAAVAEYLAQRGDYFSGIVEGYLDDAARRIVEAVAVADTAGEQRSVILHRLGGVIERHAADQVLGDLELVGLLTRENDQYRLSMPLFRRWLRRSWLDVE